jgi:hypothetical protein
VNYSTSANREPAIEMLVRCGSLLSDGGVMGSWERPWHASDLSMDFWRIVRVGAESHDAI